MRKDKQGNYLCSDRTCNKILKESDIGYVSIGMVLCEECTESLVDLTRKRLKVEKE